MTTAICTGSFDPITLGHTDVIRRAAACFDRVVICVAANTEKRNQLFTGEEKLALVQAAVADLPNVEAKLWPGLVVDFARRHGATVIVRGARSASEFEEKPPHPKSTLASMGIINGKLLPGLDTVIFPAAPEYLHISSTMARDMIRYGQPLEDCLPAAILPLLREMRKDGK